MAYNPAALNVQGANLFGAVGNGVVDDSTALNAQAAFVKANVTEGGQGAKNTSYGSLYSISYKTTQSLNWTNGSSSVAGFYGLWGQGMWNSRIVGAQTSAFPLVDFSGCEDATVRDLQILADDGYSSCALLIAPTVGANGLGSSGNPNNNPILENLSIVCDNASAIGALIVQNADLISAKNLTIQNINGPGLIHGSYLPLLGTSGLCQAGSTSTSIVMNSNTSGFTSAQVVGLQVRIFVGTGANQVRTVLTWNQGTQTATVTAWTSGTPDTSSLAGFIAVKSAYQTLGHQADQTNSSYRNSFFVASTPITLLSAINSTFSGCTLANGGSGAGPIILSKSEDGNGGFTHRFPGFYAEDDSGNATSLYQVSGNGNVGNIASLSIQGTVGLGGTGTNTIPLITNGTSNGPDLNNISLELNLSPPQNLFALAQAQAVGLVDGFSNATGLGTITAANGSTQNYVNNWNHHCGISNDTLAVVALNGDNYNCRFYGRTARMSGVVGAVRPKIALKTFVPTVVPTTGGSSQKRLTYPIAANFMGDYAGTNTTANGLISITGACTASTALDFKFFQGSTTTDISGGNIAGTYWECYIGLQDVGGGNMYYRIELWDGATLRLRTGGALASILAGSGFQLQVFENCATANSCTQLLYDMHAG